MESRMVEIAISILRHLTDDERDKVLYAFGTNKENLSHIGLGWAGSSQVHRGLLVDYCKRLEFCYKNWPGHSKPPFMPFDKTENLCREILERFGEHILRTYVAHLETVAERGEWAGFSRPERIAEHFQAWHKQCHPAQPNER